MIGVTVIIPFLFHTVGSRTRIFQRPETEIVEKRLHIERMLHLDILLDHFQRHLTPGYIRVDRIAAIRLVMAQVPVLELHGIYMPAIEKRYVTRDSVKP